ncbi:unnamed protein product [Danaus chrysippus]|uniref:(African queen) hypothetical protein n=1 Tax=Danaus chrysippus TaxID=151541 RepID=A0A8J2VXV1_9NEOP|nr:unnamed protein product [Danaus chrysippus]
MYEMREDNAGASVPSDRGEGGEGRGEGTVKADDNDLAQCRAKLPTKTIRRDIQMYVEMMRRHLEEPTRRRTDRHRG